MLKLERFVPVALEYNFLEVCSYWSQACHYNMPLPSLHPRGPARTPPFSPIRDRERPGNIRDRLHDRDRERGPLPPLERERDRALHSRDDRGRMRELDRVNDRDRIIERDRERERERGMAPSERMRESREKRERGRERYTERDRDREREQEREWRARMRVREPEREPGEITSFNRREEGEFEARDRRAPQMNPPRQQVGDSTRSLSPQRKRKFVPIVWDLEESKSGTKVSASQEAPPPSARSGPFSPIRQQHPRSSSSSSPPTPRNEDPDNLERNLASPQGSGRPPKTSPGMQTAGRVSSTPSPSGRKTEQTRSTGKVSASPSLTGHLVEQRLGRISSSPGISGRATEVTGSGGRISSSPSPSGRSVEPTQSFIMSGVAKVSTSVRGTDSDSSSPSSSDNERVSPAVMQKISERDVQSVDVHMQDVSRVSGTPDSEDALEPGQLLDSPMLVDKDEDRTPAPITIARSRWAEDTHSPEHNQSPKSRNQKSGSVGSDGQDRAPSTSPEPGEFRQEKVSNNVGKGSQDGEEYERELNKKELQELDEDSGSEDGNLQQPEVDIYPEETSPVLTGPQRRAIDMLKGCRSVDEFEKLNRIDEGTYGVVFRARDKKTGEIVALKKVKMEKEKDGFPMTSLREINILLSFHHPSVVDVKEVVVGNMLDNIFTVMEYMEHDLKGLMETMKQPFSQSEVKCLMLQLFDGVKYLHDNWVLHRDLKTSNLLLNNRGELKICDFGLARQYGDPLKEYTHEVVTLWYRAPELLLRATKYSTAIDMWSLGCIMAEFLAKEPLFPGKSVIDEIDRIFKTLGTPTEKIWPDFVNLPGVRCNFTKQPFNRLREKFPATAFAGRPTLSEKGFDLLNRLLTYDPEKRITADDALKHEWFREVPLPKAKEFMPTFPARSEHDRRVRRLMKSPDPLEEQRKRELRRGELGGGGLFG